MVIVLLISGLPKPFFACVSVATRARVCVDQAVNQLIQIEANEQLLLLEPARNSSRR